MLYGNSKYPDQMLHLIFFLLSLTSQSTIFSHVGTEPPLPGYYRYFSGSKCVFAQGHNMVEVGIEPPTSPSGVRDSTTQTPRSQCLILICTVSVRPEMEHQVLNGQCSCFLPEPTVGHLSHRLPQAAPPRQQQPACVVRVSPDVCTHLLPVSSI